MNSNEPRFGDCVFELTNLMRAKGDVGIISNIMREVIRIHRDEHCYGHTSSESPSLGNDHMLNMDTMMRMMIMTLMMQ